MKGAEGSAEADAEKEEEAKGVAWATETVEEVKGSEAAGEGKTVVVVMAEEETQSAAASAAS